MESLVGDVLNKKGWFIHTIEGEATVFEAISKMVELNIGSLVVCDEHCHIAGIMTERDYLTKIALKGRSSSETKVEEIMTKKVVVIEPGFTIKQCLYLMTEKRCRHLPVIRDGGVAGLISIGDCAREISYDREITVRYFTDFIQRRYPV
ncbi:MAG: CBS domain-containing protein [Persicimonas sp.]